MKTLHDAATCRLKIEWHILDNLSCLNTNIYDFTNFHCENLINYFWLLFKPLVWEGETCLEVSFTTKKLKFHKNQLDISVVQILLFHPFAYTSFKSLDIFFSQKCRPLYSLLWGFCYLSLCYYKANGSHSFTCFWIVYTRIYTTQVSCNGQIHILNILIWSHFHNTQAILVSFFFFYLSLS